jgi:Coenzyme PQQ synthesis protein D (PqqD)
MSLLHRPQQSSDYRLEIMDGELLLFHPAQTTIISSNSMASLIWQLCDGRRTTQEVINLLQAAYPEAKATIAAEVEVTLRQLARHGAIEFVSI